MISMSKHSFAAANRSASFRGTRRIAVPMDSVRQDVRLQTIGSRSIPGDSLAGIAIADPNNWQRLDDYRVSSVVLYYTRVKPFIDS